MKNLIKQRVAVLGSGLTGKAIAMALLDLNIDVDLIEQTSPPKNVKSNVTLSISDASLKILQRLGIKKNKLDVLPAEPTLIKYIKIVKAPKETAIICQLIGKINCKFKFIK